MQKCVVLIALVLAIVCTPVMAARIQVQPIVHETQFVYQAYEGQAGTPESPEDVAFLGYAGFGSDSVITAVPGVLSIVPGFAWENFVGAANANSDGGLWDINGDGVADYTIKNVVLVKRTPSFIQCDQVYAPKTVTQQGTINIRTWWPLMYEAPGTTWTLTVLYGTPQLVVGPNQFQDYDDDGLNGINPPSVVHQETWTWQVDVTFESLRNLINLFHEIPFGMDEVPLISDEFVYNVLLDKLQGVEDLLLAGYQAEASLLLGDFELEVSDACITSSPASPWAVKAGYLGIAQTSENPACCKLLVDVEYLSSDIFIAKKK